jgi:hypothetical protein
LVTTYKLPGMNGLEMVTQVTGASPSTHGIIIGDVDDVVPDDDAQGDAPYDILIKPLAADRFVPALRRAFGEEVPVVADAAGGPGADYGPVPSVDADLLLGSLNSLLTDVGAMAVVLVDRLGNLLAEQGAVGYIDREELTQTLAPYFASMVHVAELVGGDPWGMYFWDGDEFDIYGLSLGLHHFVCLLFGGSAGSRALGPVSIYARRAIEDMLEVIGSAAFEIQKPSPPPPTRRPAVAPRPAPQAAPAAAEPAAPEPEPEPEPAPRRRQPEPPPPPPPVVEVDDEALKSAMEELESVDLDAFWGELGSGDQGGLSGDVAGDEDALTFEEAMQLGLLPPELGGQS